MSEMWRIAALVLAPSCANVLCAFGETIRVTTWNLQWFPAGSENLLPPAVEQQRIAAAAEQLKILNPDVLLLQEIRDWDTCERLNSRASARSIPHVGLFGVPRQLWRGHRKTTGRYSGETRGPSCLE